MRKHADSARLRRLSLHHDCFMKDMMHKVSTDIVRIWLLLLGLGGGLAGTAWYLKKKDEKDQNQE